MNLELESVDIKDVRFASKTTIVNGILYIAMAETYPLISEVQQC